MHATNKKFRSDVAISLTGCRASRDGTWWSGWKREYWPAKLLRRGLKFYGYDKQTRSLIGLFAITKGGSFTYRTLNEFRKKLKEVAGDVGDPRQAKHWKKLPLPKHGQFCTGYAIRWQHKSKAPIPFQGRFPQLGWAHLPSKSISPRNDTDQSYVEGDRKYRRHLKIERSAKLRAQARDYWRTKLKGFRCLACGFSFENRYGEWGSDFVEMHHLVALASIQKAQETNVKKLVPLCANCHRMVHRHPKAPLSMATLRRILAANSRKVRRRGSP